MGSSEENRRSSTSGGWEVEQEIPQCVTIMLTRYRLNPTDPTVNPTVNLTVNPTMNPTMILTVNPTMSLKPNLMSWES